MNKPVLIIVAGGSASGKSTVVSKIRSRLTTKDAVIISHDDYYKDQTNLTIEERKKTNYDHPNALDNDLLYDDLKKLLNGEEIIKPKYDFINHTRSEKKEVVKPAKVIILEGILSLQDERIRELADIKIFVECDDDIRFIRRLKRDMNERGRTLDTVVEQYLSTVKPMHYKFVKPTKRYADIIIPNDNKHDVAVDMIMSTINEIIRER
jgi:uridine kinase